MEPCLRAAAQTHGSGGRECSSRSARTPVRRGSFGQGQHTLPAALDAVASAELTEPQAAANEAFPWSLKSGRYARRAARRSRACCGIFRFTHQRPAMRERLRAAAVCAQGNVVSMSPARSHTPDRRRHRFSMSRNLGPVDGLCTLRKSGVKQCWRRAAFAAVSATGGGGESSFSVHAGPTAVRTDCKEKTQTLGDSHAAGSPCLTRKPGAGAAMPSDTELLASLYLVQAQVPCTQGNTLTRYSPSQHTDVIAPPLRSHGMLTH